MKNKVFLSFLLVVISLVNLFAQEEQRSEKYELSKDKSTVTVSHLKTTIENFKSLNVDKRSQYYLSSTNDSILPKLFTNLNGIYLLPDSITHPWSELFIDTKVIQRQLEIRYGAEVVYTEREPTVFVSATWKKGGLFYLFLGIIIAIWMFFSKEREIFGYICLFSLITLIFLYIIIFNSIKMTVFDYYFKIFIIFLPAIIISSFKKTKKTEHKFDVMTTKFGPIKH